MTTAPLKLNPKTRRSMRGVAAIELALVMIPLVMLTLAAVEFSRAISIYNQLTKAARDGARYLSFFDPVVASEYPSALARSRMLYGSANAPAGTKPIVTGLTDTMIKICDRVDASHCPGESFLNVNTGAGTINLVKVTITGYTFTPMFPGASKLAAMTFEPISVTMRQGYP